MGLGTSLTAGNTALTTYAVQQLLEAQRETNALLREQNALLARGLGLDRPRP